MKTYCLRFNNNTNIVDLKKVTMKNKVIRAKSRYATRMANKNIIKKWLVILKNKHDDILFKV